MKTIKVNKIVGYKRWVAVEVVEGSEEHKELIRWNRAMNYVNKQDKKEMEVQNAIAENEISAEQMNEETGFEFVDMLCRTLRSICRPSTKEKPTQYSARSLKESFIAKVRKFAVWSMSFAQRAFPFAVAAGVTTTLRAEATLRKQSHTLMVV